MSEIVYRDACLEDAAALAAFAAKSFVDTFGHLYPPHDLEAYLTRSYGRDIQAEELADPSFYCRLALSGDAIVGFVQGGPMDMDIAHEPTARELYRLYVDAPVKGQGVADTLMRWVLERERAAGAAALFLSVWENNARAQGFYRRYGFTHVGEHKFMVGSVADRDLIWKLAL